MQGTVPRTPGCVTPVLVTDRVPPWAPRHPKVWPCSVCGLYADPDPSERVQPLPAPWTCCRYCCPTEGPRGLLGPPDTATWLLQDILQQGLSPDT